MDVNIPLSESTLFPRGEKVPEAFSKYFIGVKYFKELTTPDSPLNCGIGIVTFEPGCRTDWHAHPTGEFLLITDGRGWYQEEGKTARELHAGDVVEIPPNVKHWQGAAADSWFIYLAIDPDVTLGPPIWFEPVTDEEYILLKSLNHHQALIHGLDCRRGTQT
ncbi:cupin domain-containing protein [Paenibacillus spongiae]|uniref:Cupin domain-containing protein n=1 Tax=Paenibacillus spongiae TaxID=2909671 RepID=A0ABY5S393_9BACL|nr:cupin domain-containing protein [Paenibacillus spongiae]UVI27327.1 cupin domain-containing protein [Paenibacillus spongiae]